MWRIYMEPNLPAFVTGESRMATGGAGVLQRGAATYHAIQTHVFSKPNASPTCRRTSRTAQGEGVLPAEARPLCCTAALNRIVPWYVTHMWMATYDNGWRRPATALQVTRWWHRVPVVSRARRLSFNETIEISCNQPGGSLPLNFRIPGWCVPQRLT